MSTPVACIHIKLFYIYHSTKMVCDLPVLVRGQRFFYVWLFKKMYGSGADFWQNRGFNDKSVKTSKIVHSDLLIKIGYGPIA